MIIESQLFLNIISFIARDKFDGINILGLIFVRSKKYKTLINHELIHTRQYVETLWIGFFIIYLFDYLHALLKYRNFGKAYERIRFEQEANKYRFSDDYLQIRGLFAWRKFSV